MPAASSNVVEFPLDRRRELKSCPHCGTRSDVYRIGRLLWAYCDAHELRWVAADLHDTAPVSMDRQQLRRGLEFLAAFIEVSR